MTDLPAEPSPNSTLVKRKVEPAAVPPEKQEKQRKGFLRWLGEILGIVEYYDASDIARAKEIGFKKMEASVAKDAGEALKKLAEAEVEFAMAEAIRRKAAIKDPADTQVVVGEIEQAKQRVLDAISVIRQKGGEVGFDAEQIRGLLGMENASDGDDEVAEAESA